MADSCYHLSPSSKFRGWRHGRSLLNNLSAPGVLWIALLPHFFSLHPPDPQQPPGLVEWPRSACTIHLFSDLVTNEGSRVAPEILDFRHQLITDRPKSIQMLGCTVLRLFGWVLEPFLGSRSSVFFPVVPPARPPARPARPPDPPARPARLPGPEAGRPAPSPPGFP